MMEGSEVLSSLKANRRQARSARRRRDRFLQRQSFLINEMVRRGLMPETTMREKSRSQRPLFDKKKALDKELLALMTSGRAFFHINQRRGFKSNRKSQDNEAGVVKQSIAELEMRLSETGARTLGEFLADRHENWRACGSEEARRPKTLHFMTFILTDICSRRSSTRFGRLKLLNPFTL